MSRSVAARGRSIAAVAWLLIVALLSFVAHDAVAAERDRGRAIATGGAPASQAAELADPGLNDLFEDLAVAQAPALEDHVAGQGLSAGELALVIVFLIVFFPVGIILLIVFLLR
ncbi:MAG: hypothetical protein M9894_38380 [Planctomycetes bacterium]|nr:hypothetical protein [Planctomycetota bacterium]